MNPQIIDLWIWRDATGAVRYVSLREAGFLQPMPLIRENENLAALLEGETRRPVKDVLQTDLIEVLQQTGKPGAVVRLHLLSSLPEVWQTVPFECFPASLAGEARLQVIRHANPPHHLRGSSSTPEGILLDLWPRDEPVRPVQVLSRHPICHRYTRNPADRLEYPEGAYSWLAVVAHGSEQAEGAPFRLADNTPWQLPRLHDLPPLVLLMACGTACGNMLRYGKTLLDAGVRTVVVATGPLDAEAARDFLTRFAEAWPTGQSIGELWFTLQTEDVRPKGCRKLYLLGDPDWRITQHKHLCDWNTLELAQAVKDEWAQSTRGPALLNGLEKLTLAQLIDANDLEGIERKFWVSLGIEAPGTIERQRLLNIMAEPLDNLAPMVQWWLIPLLVSVAESLNHPRMKELMPHRERFERSPHIPLFVYHYWSLPYYRMGYYGQAMSYVMNGLRRYQPERHHSFNAGLLGMLGGLLLDLNLPRTTLNILDRLSDDLGCRTDANACDEKFYLLDRQARCAMRVGEMHRAHALYQHKRKQALDQGEDGLRETGWLLYVAAWSGKAGSDEREAVIQALTQTGDDPALLASNSNTTYLLRALAAWAWLGQDQAAWHQVAAWKAQLHQYLWDRGPLGFIWVFQYLAARDMGLPLPDLSEWEQLEVDLESQAYWLELAILNALLGKEERSQRALNRQQAQQRNALKELEPIPDWLQGELGEISEEARERAQRERDYLKILSSREKPEAADVTELVTKGLIPL